MIMFIRDDVIQHFKADSSVIYLNLNQLRQHCYVFSMRATSSP